MRGWIEFKTKRGGSVGVILTYFGLYISACSGMKLRCINSLSLYSPRPSDNVRMRRPTINKDMSSIYNHLLETPEFGTFVIEQAVEDQHLSATGCTGTLAEERSSNEIKGKEMHCSAFGKLSFSISMAQSSDL